MNSNQPQNVLHDLDSDSARAGRSIMGQGEMADLIRAHDWGATQLGAGDTWSETFIASINAMLLSPFASCIFWGPDQILLYNDSYSAFLGSEKHPRALGCPAKQSWQEIWPTIAPILDRAFGGSPTTSQNQLIPIEVDGKLQDRYWTYCFYSVYEQGRIAGVTEIAIDTTAQVHATRDLSASEARSKRILQSIGDAVIVTDEETRITRMNSVAESLTGWPLAEAEGAPLAEVFRIVNETSRQPVESPADKVRRLGSIVGLANHTILIGKDGLETHIDDSGAPIRDDDGKLTGIVLVFRDIGERRAAERERDAQTVRLQQTLDASNDGVVKLDRNWRIIFLNRRGREMLASSGDVLGKNHWQSFPSAVFEGSPWLNHYYAAMDQGISGEFEHFYPDPLNIWMHISAHPVSDGIVVFFRDTTEQHRAAEALRASDERLRLALEAANGVGIWDWDVPAALVYSDAAFAKLYGVDPDIAARGVPVEEFFRNMHPDDLRSCRQALDRTFQQQQDFAAEYRLLQPDGSIRWVFAVGCCTFDARGTPLRFPGLAIDITTRKQTEQDLRASEERLRIAAETANIGTWHLDIDSGRFESSSIGEMNLGLTPGNDFHYEDLVASIHPDDLAAKQEAFSHALATRTDYRAEYRYYWPDGSLHWIIASGRGIYDPSGKATQMVGVSLDVTERHLAEAALLQSEKLAAVGRLASSIAHEINNPLESVTNLLYLARNTTEPAEIQQYLALAERELRRVSVISNQTLRFHKQSTKPRSVTCEELFESVLSVYQGRIVNSRIHIERRKRATQPIFCFEGEIRQVMSNLVGNAIDALPPEGGRLLLRSREQTHWPTGRRGTVLTVADTGSGISAHSIRKIFEPFFTTKGIGGTGLGLWVSQEIVARHEGRLRVRSSQHPGRSGTVFTLFLPFDAVSREPDAVSREPDAVSREASSIPDQGSL